MVAAEATSESIKDAIPQLGKKLIFVQGTTAAGNDWITVTPLIAVEGAFLIATDGTVGTMTFATNVITITSAAKTYSGIAWGY